MADRQGLQRRWVAVLEPAVSFSLMAPHDDSLPILAPAVCLKDIQSKHTTSRLAQITVSDILIALIWTFIRRLLKGKLPSCLMSVSLPGERY